MAKQPASPSVHVTDENEQTPSVVTARCPSCGRVSQFRQIGAQEWPEAVARQAGLPPVVRLYLCGVCQSTISEQNLQQP